MAVSAVTSSQWVNQRGADYQYLKYRDITSDGIIFYRKLAKYK